MHCPISTAILLPILEVPVAVPALAAKLFLNNWSRPIKTKSGQRSGPNHTTGLRCCHCDGEVVTYLTNGHPVFSTRLLSMSKPRALLRAFYTVRSIDDAGVQRAASPWHTLGIGSCRTFCSDLA